MAYSTFKGGIHPHKRKRFTREKPVEIYLPRRELIYPLSQHVGGASIPVVKPGERVLEGQLIAKMSFNRGMDTEKWYIYTMEYYSAIKTNELIKFLANGWN